MIRLDIEKEYTYHELVADVITAGIAPQRAYMFLSSLGIKGDLCRFWDRKTKEYKKPVKVAVNEAGGVILSPKSVFIGIDITKLTKEELVDNKPNKAVVPPVEYRPTMRDIMPSLQEKTAPGPLVEKETRWQVYEVEPSLYPPGVKDSRTLLVSDKEKADMIPAFQDMTGIDKDDPANQTLLDNGNRFYATEIDSFDSEDKAKYFAKNYAAEEGIDISLPTKYRKYYEILDK